MRTQKKADGIGGRGKDGAMIGSTARLAPISGLHMVRLGWSGVLPQDPRGHATLILYDGGLQRVGQLPTQL